MSPRFVLGRENVPCVAEVVNRSLKADCTDFTELGLLLKSVQKCGAVENSSLLGRERHTEKISALTEFRTSLYMEARSGQNYLIN